MRPRGASLSLARGRRAGRSVILPSSVASAWYRMPLSTPVSSEWETIVDALGGASLTQTDADRKLAAGTSASGRPIGTYDGSDMLRMPLGANNFSTSLFGLAWQVQVANTGAQYLFAMLSNSAAVSVMGLVASGGALQLTVYIGSNANGRVYTTTTNAYTAATPFFPRIQLDMSKTAECDTTGLVEDAKVRIFSNETPLAITATNEGAGGTLTTLRSPTGAAIFGSTNDSDTPAGALDNGAIHGPETYVLLRTPTAAQGRALRDFNPYA